jgi:hypothetical protein
MLLNIITSACINTIPDDISVFPNIPYMILKTYMLAVLALSLVYSLLSQVNILSENRKKLDGKSSGLPCGCGTNEVCFSSDTSGWKAKCAYKCCCGKEISCVPNKISVISSTLLLF